MLLLPTLQCGQRVVLQERLLMCVTAQQINQPVAQQINRWEKKKSTLAPPSFGREEKALSSMAYPAV